MRRLVVVKPGTETQGSAGMRKCALRGVIGRVPVNLISPEIVGASESENKTQSI